MKKYYCKQVPPELQQDNLFWLDKNHELHWEDEAYDENVIIFGNNDFVGYETEEYEKIKNIDNVLYEYEAVSNPHTNHCYWDNVTQFVEYYLSKKSGKKYTKQEIHKWKELLNDWDNYHNEEENILKALQLMTGKEWRQTCIKGCMQREYQYLYVSEEITQKDIDYIEMCYFNTGTEWKVYESKDDFDNNEYAYSLYVDGYDVKSNLAEEIGCEEKDIVCLEFDGWTQSPKYKEI